MNPLLEQATTLRRTAETHCAARRWAEAVGAYEALAKTWIALAGMANAPSVRDDRMKEYEKALAKASECRTKAGCAQDGDPDSNAGTKIRDTPRDGTKDDQDVTSASDPGSNPDESEFLVTDKPKETLDDIMGMDAAKREVQDFLAIVNDPEGARRFNLVANAGILLYGPPGNGKTMFGKAIAHCVDAPFYYASGASIRSKWVGEGPRRLHALFQHVRRNPTAVLFFDEIDTLIPQRDENTHNSDKQLVTQFLQEVGGFTEGNSRTLLLGATNCPWDIDAAAFRTRRFDIKIYIGAPDEEARLGMFKRAFQKVPLAPDVDLRAWAKRLDFYTGSDITGLVTQACKAAFRRYRENHGDEMVRETDLEEALPLITKSITPELLKKYEDFKASRSS